MHRNRGTVFQSGVVTATAAAAAAAVIAAQTLPAQANQANQALVLLVHVLARRQDQAGLLVQAPANPPIARSPVLRQDQASLPIQAGHLGLRPLRPGA